MTLPPSSAMSRFGMFYMVGAVVLVLGMLWLLDHLPRPPAKPAAKPKPTPAVSGNNPR